MTREFIDFVNLHRDEDTARLLLSAARYPSIDMPAAVQQIEGLRTARVKWPSLLGHEDFEYPPRLNREQASSEATARYKAERLMGSAGSLADLTGGMGIDTLAFATHRSQSTVHYIERDPALCNLMRRNLAALGIANVTVHCADSLDWLATLDSPLDTLYVDPARRAASGRKVAAFEDCQPDILAHLPLLRSRARRLVVKASPMIDIDRAIEQLGSVSEVHIVAVKGECKEVLFLCDGSSQEPVIHCVNLQSDDDTFAFTRSEESAASAPLCSAVGDCLFEPNASLMKGGAFRLVAQRFGMAMLGSNTHLYTPDRHPADKKFPGRTFRVLQEIKPSRRIIAKAIPDGRAHVVTRNYPLAAADLQRQLGLREGGDLFLVACTVATRPTAFLCTLQN